MKNFNNKSGFTLIEIIVVLIIIGVLAAIALPNLFGNIQKSKGAQALTSMEEIKTALEGCLTSNSGISAATAPCTTTAYATPSNVGGWTYSIGPSAGAAQAATAGGETAIAGNYASGNLTYSLTGSDNQATQNTIVLNRAANGTWTCSTGTASSYTGIC